MFIIWCCTMVLLFKVNGVWSHWLHFPKDFPFCYCKGRTTHSSPDLPVTREQNDWLMSFYPPRLFACLGKWWCQPRWSSIHVGFLWLNYQLASSFVYLISSCRPFFFRKHLFCGSQVTDPHLPFYHSPFKRRISHIFTLFFSRKQFISSFCELFLFNYCASTKCVREA